ncbi:hypothetical protein [Motilibacter deserti]|uniref:Uncharacterized protein n=1 Tax=Motilibacter deserti TaxID=2714956 RepID=A0ABX0GT00_9ACTN|nr:hypothetical protein [Motilibacter deserti]NHC14014.1 hypothetical protein [Motilibacter deserti]
MPRSAGTGAQPQVRPGFLVAGGGALVVAVAAVAWSATTGDDSDLETAFDVPVAVASATPTPSGDAQPAEVPVTSGRTAGGSALRNPFVPVVAAVSPTPTATQTPTAAPTAAVSPVPSPAATAAPSASPDGTGAPATTPSPSPSATAVTVKLVAVAADNAAATFLVAGKTYVAVPGAAFATDFTLERLEGGSCGTIAYASTKKDLCEGETVAAKLG